ncbi:MAG: hypothetical protein GTO18_22160 [Anaerolineales bacterium]|nr:hypothetical protein [Anaerolineales bacterium]
MTKTSSAKPDQLEPVRLEEWLTLIQQEQEQQTKFLKITTISVTVLAVVTVLVLVVTACNTLGLFFLPY